jgi:hypothetical protein
VQIPLIEWLTSLISLHYEYLKAHPKDETVLYIGWLDGQHPFATAEPDREILIRLGRILKRPVNTTAAGMPVSFVAKRNAHSSQKLRRVKYSSALVKFAWRGRRAYLMLVTTLCISTSKITCMTRRKSFWMRSD